MLEGGSDPHPMVEVGVMSAGRPELNFTRCHGDDDAATGAAGGVAAMWRRWTEPASPLDQSARKLRKAGMRNDAMWQAAPAGLG